MPAVMRASAAYLPLLLLAFAWEAVARLNLVDSSALPPLSKVAVAWIDLVRGRELIDNGAASLYRGSVGLLLAIFGGGGLGLLMARWRLLDVFVNPLVELFYPLPKSALIPVTVLWLGFGDGSKILLIFLGCMIPFTIRAYNGGRDFPRRRTTSGRRLPQRRGNFFDPGAADRLGDVCPQRQGDPLHAAAVFRGGRAHLRRRDCRRSVAQSRCDSVPCVDRLCHRRCRRRRARRDDGAQPDCTLVLRSDHIGRLPDAEDRVFADHHSMARAL